MLWSILFYPVVPFDYSLQAGRSGVHSRVVPSTRHTLGPRDAVRRYLGLVSPVCCGCDVRVEPRSGPLGQDGIDYFFLLSHLTVLFIGPCVYLKVHHAHGASLVWAGEGLYGGGIRTWPS